MTTHLYLRCAHPRWWLCMALLPVPCISQRVYCIYTTHTLATLGARLHYSSISIEYTHIMTPFSLVLFRALASATTFCSTSTSTSHHAPHLPLRISRTFKLSLRTSLYQSARPLHPPPRLRMLLCVYLSMFLNDSVWYGFCLVWIGLAWINSATVGYSSCSHCSCSLKHMHTHNTYREPRTICNQKTNCWIN